MRILLSCALVFICGLLGVLSTQAAEKNQELLETFDKAIAEQIETQEDIDDWSQEKQNLVNEILDLKTRLKWYSYQIEQYDAYIQEQEQRLANLANREQEVKSLRMHLEPFLEEILDRLKDLVEKDLPFLPEERKARLDFLETSLSAYGLKLSERLRRILEALLVEAGYGNSVEVRDRRLMLQGKPTLVRVLRLGRIALFYTTMTGDQAGIWDPETRHWEALPPSQGRLLLKAMDIAEHKRAAELVKLPLPQSRVQLPGDQGQ